jgi:O-antigen ligase
MLSLLAVPLLFLTGFGHGLLLYLTRGREIDPTLTGRTAIWVRGWEALQQSPWAGLGFWADRYFLDFWNIHNTFLQALMQSGYLGFIPFVIALVWAWIGILRFYSNRPAGEASSLPGELLGVMTFFTVYSITEITYSFYSVGWMAMAPLFAHLQLRVYQEARKGQSTRLWSVPVRGPTAEEARQVFPPAEWRGGTSKL